MTGPDCMVFERWCIFSRTWKLENLEPINMTERGDTMVYRAGSLLEAECPGLVERKASAQESATFQFDDDVNGPVASSSQASSSRRAGPSSQGASSTLASSSQASVNGSGAGKRRCSESWEEGPSSRPFNFKSMENEQEEWEEYNAEDYEN
ncbi:hypothetical protein B0H12DRAFT_1246757 [Mycena haematopus]|nr:hypothetical protein B0H12DRAFT_1246757 [Mycena haematopus]